MSARYILAAAVLLALLLSWATVIEPAPDDSVTRLEQQFYRGGPPCACGLPATVANLRKIGAVSEVEVFCPGCSPVVWVEPYGGTKKDMTNWYIYYRLLRAVRDGEPTSSARMELQNVLIDLREKAVKEWPGATAQNVQDFFEHLARNTDGEPLSEGAARHLAEIEGWSVRHWLTGGAVGVGDPCIAGCPACAEGRAGGYRGRW